jgi:pimeloyl-ACP methyl ester carboxylesterase
MEFFTTAAGITVHVWDTKDEKSSAEAPVLMLLHGYLETMYVFNELVEALKRHYRVIVIDMPGHGLTDYAPAGPDGERVNTLSFGASVVVGVLDKCGVDKAVLAGHSMGGYVMLQTLREHPERVEKAILLHSHPYPDSPQKIEDRGREKQFVAAGKLLAVADISIPNMYYSENLRACDEKIRETVELCETHDPEGIIASIEGLRRRDDLSDVLEHPPVPVLLIHGDHDAFLPLERVEEMKKKFPDVRYALIPNAGHNSFIEQPAACIEALTTFLP